MKTISTEQYYKSKKGTYVFIGWFDDLRTDDEYEKVKEIHKGNNIHQYFVSKRNNEMKKQRLDKGVTK